MASCANTSAPAQRSLTAIDGVVQHEWLTGWMLLPGMSVIDAVLKNKGVVGNFQSQLVMQLAAVRTDNPNGPTLLATARSGGGEWAELGVDIATGNSGYMYVRFGVAYGLSTGQTPARADVELQISYNACGKIAGAINQQLFASTTTDGYVAITPFVPSISAPKVRAAVSVTSLTGDFRWRMAYRTAATNTQNADAWTTTFGAWQTAGEVNTTDLTPNLAGKMWVQIGIQFALSGGTPGQASISASVAIVK
jgi:hypothetical protein